MFRPHLISIAMLVLASVTSGVAQDGEISIDSKASAVQVKEWLQSSDSRKVAWGAYFASKSDDVINNDLYLEIMSKRLALWIAPPNPAQVSPNSDGSFPLSAQAISQILNALIEKNQSVPASSLIPIMSTFPVKSLILAARLSENEATPFLQSWYEKRNPPLETRHPSPSDQAVIFAQVAGMLLAKAPPPGFAASVLAESGEKLSFWVAEGWQPREFFSRVGRTGRCDSEDQELTLAPWTEEELSIWPPAFGYLLLQNAVSPYAGTLLVDAGGERISYRRVSELTRPSSCYGLEYYSDETRHYILAEMLRIDDKEMPWPAHQDVTYIQGGKEEFLSALTRQIELEESKFRATAKALRERGYLTESEANTIRPKLTVTVNDARSLVFDGQDHLPPPLPKLVTTDSRTSISYDKR